MFAIKDLESIKKLSSLLVIPLIAAACLVDGAFADIHTAIAQGFSIAAIPLLSAVGEAVWVCLLVAMVGISLILFDKVIVWLDVRSGESFVMLWLGFAALTMGVLVLSAVISSLPRTPLNPIWHLAFLAYGFSLIDRSAK